jgi:hypothetical protein
MHSTTRRGFIRRGLAGATALGLFPHKASLTAAPLSVPDARPGAAQASASTEFVVTPTPVRTGFGGVGFHAQM